MKLKEYTNIQDYIEKKNLLNMALIMAISKNQKDPKRTIQKKVIYF